MATSTNSAKESLRMEQRAQREQHAVGEQQNGDAELTQALENTFPASDPVATQTATTAGAKRRMERAKSKQ